MQQLKLQGSTRGRRLLWAWLCLLALAVASRLFGLQATPMAPNEAARSVKAWTAAREGTWPKATEGPLLLTGQTLLFLIAGPGNPVARLLPALAGVALVMVPLLWRRYLGDLGALVSAGLLLASPLTLSASRRVDGSTIAVLGAFVVLSVFLQRRSRADSVTKHHEGLMTAGLVLGLTGGASFYDAAIGGLVAILGRAKMEARPALPWQRILARTVGIGLLISTAFGFHWSGWAGLADGAAAWLAEWRGADMAPRISPLGLLLLYEPLLLMAAITGLTWHLLRRETHDDRLPLRFALWAAVSTLTLSLRPGSSTEALAAITLPLALLGGYAAQRMLTAITPKIRLWMGIHVLVSALFWSPGVFALAQHTDRFTGTDQTALMVLGFIVLIALQVMLYLILSMQMPETHVWRGALLGFAAILLFVQLSFAGGLGFTRSDSSLEPAIGISGSRDLHQLRQALEELATLRGVREDSLRIVLIDQDPELTSTIAWALRDYARLQVSTVWPQSGADLVVSTDAGDVAPPSDDAAVWLGARFVAVTRYAGPPPTCAQLIPLDCRDAVRWYLYRKAPTPAIKDHAILWQPSPESG